MPSMKQQKIVHEQKPVYDRNKIVDCPHCGRKFNFKAADSHIAYCSKKAKMQTLHEKPMVTSMSPARNAVSRHMSICGSLIVEAETQGDT